MNAQRRLHAIVRGDVQGVGFRWFVLRLATSARLDGWVANLPDGSLECLAEGSREALERLLEALRKGPVGAHVEAVEASWPPHGGDLHGFRITG